MKSLNTSQDGQGMQVMATHQAHLLYIGFALVLFRFYVVCLRCTYTGVLSFISDGYILYKGVLRV